MAARFLLVGAAALCTVTAAACQAPVSLPDEYLGRWAFVGSSGGITGGGTGESAGGWIVITRRNEIESYGPDGARLSTESFELSRGASIYSSDPEWILDESSVVPRVIRVYQGGRLTISENVYDGFMFAYEWVP